MGQPSIEGVNVKIRNLQALAIVLLALSCHMAATAQSVERGPYLQLATPQSVVIRWRTSAPIGSTVFYGTESDALTEVAQTSGIRTDHSVRLSGLSANTRYFYAVGSSEGPIAGEEDASYTFVTAPVVGSEQRSRIWVIGDSGTKDRGARSVRDAYKAFAGDDKADLWLMLGDNAYPEGTDAEYQAAVFDVYPEILRQTPLWPTIGNHDARESADTAAQTGPYFDIFTLPRNAQAGGVASGTEAYYSFDYANIHFICLESYETDRSVLGPMMTWLENDLAANEQKWTIAFWHHPPYSKGSHDSDSESLLIEMRENALPILEAYGVDLVLSGHSHSYERSFLLDGHYGRSDTLRDDMVRDAGDGRDGGDGRYRKALATANDGAVYIVAGSSGTNSGGLSEHPVMYTQFNVLGSVVLDVAGSRLDARFLDASGDVLDEFTIEKGTDLTPPRLTSAYIEDDTHVVLEFSEPLDELGASRAENYSMDNGIAVEAASLVTARQVRLTTSRLLLGTRYTVSVSDNLLDRAGNNIPPNERAQLVHTQRRNITFQDGVSPDSFYAGTRDAFIASASPNTNYGGDDELQIDGSGRTGEAWSLLKFDVSAIPRNATVESARLSLGITNASTGTYSVYGLGRRWSEQGVTWTQTGDGGAWSQQGARGASDRDDDVVLTLRPVAAERLSSNFDEAGIALIQRWVANSATNHGVIIGDSNERDGVDVRSRESSNSRPSLSVTFSVPANDDENLPDTVAPSTPLDLRSVSVDANSVSLRWRASSDAVGVSGYRVFRDDVAVAAPAGTDFTDEGLAPATLYDYAVTAFDAIGNESAKSELARVTTLATPPPPEDGRVTQNFEDGLDAYDGTSDATLSNASPDANDGSATAVKVDGRSGTDGQDVALIRWDLRSIPRDAVIESARITFGVLNASAATYRLYAVRRNWREDEASWNRASRASAWQQSGARGPDDRGRTVLGNFILPSTGLHGADLNAAGVATVQAWVNGEFPNYGFVLDNPDNSDGFDFASSDASTQRPRLTLRYRLSGSQ